MRPVVLVILVNAACLAAALATYALGQSYAPEMMDSQVVMAPLMLGVLGLGGWLLYWSVQTLSGGSKKTDD